MRPSRTPLGAVLLGAFIAFSALSPCCLAEVAPPPEAPLTPLDAPGFVQIAACTVRVDVVCDTAPCTVQVEHEYHLRNRDRIKGKVVRLGMAGRAAQTTYPSPIALENAQGERLEPLKSERVPTWVLSLAPNEQRTVRLAYKRPLRSQYLVDWQLDLSPLAAWGVVESIRVELRLPQHATDQALLRIEPSGYDFDGRVLVWESESVEEPPVHTVMLISPPAWSLQNELQSADAHRELAQLYGSIQADGDRLGVPVGDYFGQIVAELHEAITDSPHEVPLRLELAQVYLERASAAGDLRLNYLLLAAQHLVIALEQDPANRDIATRLNGTYFGAAQEAKQRGDPEAAIVYLKRARQVPGARRDSDLDMEELMLEWALDLAKQGQVVRALDQLQGTLSPATVEALLHYVPPFVSVRTDVALRPGSRRVSYDLMLYPPSAAETLSSLDRIAERLAYVQDLSVVLERDPTNLVSTTLTVKAVYEELADLKDLVLAIVEALDSEEELLHAFLAVPWMGVPETHVLDTHLLCEWCAYREHVDLASLRTTWERESQYVRWRQIELRNKTTTSVQEEMERQLGLLALREQRHLWEQLPSGSYWTYRVTFGQSEGTPEETWLVRWGQTRTLDFERRSCHWALVLRIGLMVLVGFVFLTAAVVLGRRTLARGRL